MKLGNRDKKSRGFTLVEMVISVAFLAIISMFLLQLFISARNLNLKANDLDRAVSVAQKVVEAVKACDRPSDIAQSALPEGAVVAESGKETGITLLLDSGWKPAVAAQNGSGDGNAAYKVNAVITPSAGNGSENGKAGVYTVKVDVIRTRPYSLEKNGSLSIYSLSAEKYFPDEGK